MRDKLIKLLRDKMKKILHDNEITVPRKLKDSTFGFCFGQATFDVLMDIDRELKLGAFYKKGADSK